MKRFILFILILAIILLAVGFGDKPRRYPTSDYEFLPIKGETAYGDCTFVFPMDTMKAYYGATVIKDSIDALEARVSSLAQTKQLVSDSLSIFSTTSETKGFISDSITVAETYTDTRETAITTAYEGAINDSLGQNKVIITNQLSVGDTLHLKDAKIYKQKSTSTLRIDAPNTDGVVNITDNKLEFNGGAKIYNTSTNLLYLNVDTTKVNTFSMEASKKFNLGEYAIFDDGGYLSFDKGGDYSYDTTIWNYFYEGVYASALQSPSLDLCSESGNLCLGLADSIEWKSSPSSFGVGRIFMQYISGRPYLTLENTGIRLEPSRFVELADSTRIWGGLEILDTDDDIRARIDTTGYAEFEKVNTVIADIDSTFIGNEYSNVAIDSSGLYYTGNTQPTRSVSTYAYNMYAYADTYNGVTCAAAGAGILSTSAGEGFHYIKSFDDGQGSRTAESCIMTLRLPNDYADGTDFKVCVFWTAVATTGNVVFGIGVCDVGSGKYTTDNATWSTGTVSAPSSVYEVQHTEITFSGTGYVGDSPISIVLYRDADNGFDTMSGDAYVLECGVEYKAGR